MRELLRWLSEWAQLLNDFLKTLDRNLSQLHQSLQARDEVTARRLSELEENSKQQQRHIQFLDEALNVKSSLASTIADEVKGGEEGNGETKGDKEEGFMLESGKLPRTYEGSDERITPAIESERGDNEPKNEALIRYRQKLAKLDEKKRHEIQPTDGYCDTELLDRLRKFRQLHETEWEAEQRERQSRKERQEEANADKVVEQLQKLVNEKLK